MKIKFKKVKEAIIRFNPVETKMVATALGCMSSVGIEEFVEKNNVDVDADDLNELVDDIYSELGTGLLGWSP
jgi:hypothetical protein